MATGKGGKAFIVIGATGSGKSSFVKNCIARIPDAFRHIFDVNGEYYENRALPEIKTFLKEADNRQHSFIVFEESTVFFSNRGRSDLMTKILVGKRHDANVIFLLFHSIRAVPFYIFDLCNYAVVFNTNDPEYLVKKKHPRLYDAYRRVRIDKVNNTHGNKFWLNYQIVKLS
jgi:DNA helicase HerA-like ATPase